MICYKDRTFCQASDCLHFETCTYALTEEVEREAKEFGLPIAWQDNDTSRHCYKPYERKTNSHHPAGN